MSRNYFSQKLLLAGFTAVFIGYLAVWLPGPAAGLSFIWVEMGEWIKFMGMGPTRNWFYFPPISLGLMLAVWTVGWPNGRWQTWAMRAVAVAVSLLAFPALEDLTGQVSYEYTPRVWAIVLVVLVVAISGVLGRWSQAVRLKWLMIALLALVGLILPSWVYGQARTAVSEVVGLPIGFGLGFWLTGVGFLAAILVALQQFFNPKMKVETE
jgi:hypothetical protein